MNCQLVLQFSASSMAEFDRLVSLETKLLETLDDTAVVDGHDFGSGTFNIFVLTNEPTATFTQAHQVILDEAIPNELRSAYREATGVDYVILWPRRSRYSVFCRTTMSVLEISHQLTRHAVTRPFFTACLAETDHIRPGYRQRQFLHPGRVRGPASPPATP